MQGARAGWLTAQASRVKEYQNMQKQYLLASDFDQTLSFNDSGVVLSELIGFRGFHDKVVGLSHMNLVQQGAELSYLILHDPEFGQVPGNQLLATPGLPTAREPQIALEKRLGKAAVLDEGSPILVADRDR